jgi:endoglycosylceramidase
MLIIGCSCRHHLSYRWLVGTSFLLLLALAPAAGEGYALAANRSDLQWLHVDGPSIVREDGAVMILRGVNIPALPRSWLTRAGYKAYLDVAKSMGFNVIRLPVTWAELETSPDKFSATYLDSIKNFVDLAGERSMYVIVDMHQFQMDGFPAWALPKFESPGQAAAEFWLDPARQLELVKAWETLASLLRDESTVAGYDLLNEPYGGTIMWQDFAPVLNEFYSRVIGDIRNIDARHIIFFEPTEGVSILGQHIALKPSGMNIALSPHFYVRGPADYLDSVVQQLHNLAAGTWNIPLWIGEFGGLQLDVTNPDSLHSLAVTLELFDRYALGWAFCGLTETSAGPRLTDGNGRTSAQLTGIMTRIFPTSYTANDLAFMSNDTRFSLNATADPTGHIEVSVSPVSESMVPRCIDCVFTKDEDRHSITIEILPGRTGYFYLDSPENLALMEEAAKSELEQARRVSSELEATLFHSQLARKHASEIREMVDSMQGNLTTNHYEFVLGGFDRVEQLQALTLHEEESYERAEAFVNSVSQGVLGSQGYLSKMQLFLLLQADKSLDQGNYKSAIEFAKRAEDLPHEPAPEEADPMLGGFLGISSLVLIGMVALFTLLRVAWYPQIRPSARGARRVRQFRGYREQERNSTDREHPLP